MKAKLTYEELLKKVKFYEKKYENNGLITDVNSVVDIDIYIKDLERVNNIIEDSQFVIYIANIETFSLKYTSKNIEILTGYSAKDFLTNNITLNQLIHPNDIATLKLEFADNIKNKSFTYTPYRIVCKSGEVKWIEDNVTIIKNENGKAIYSKGNVKDITQQKNINDRLSQLTNIIERSELAVIKWIPKENTLINFTTNNISKIFGYSQKEFLSGKINYLNIIHPEDLSCVKKEMARNNKNRLDLYIHKPYRIITKYGDVKWIKDETTIVRDKNGEIISGEAILTDISGQVNIENKLKQEYTKQHAILNAFEDGVYLCSANYDIEYLNKGMLAKIGRNAVGEKCYKAIHNLENPCSWCYFKDLKKGKKSTTVEIKFNDKHYLINSVLLGDNSKVSIYNDVTKLKEIEQTILKKNQEYEILNTELNLVGSELSEKNRLLLESKNRFSNLFEKSPVAIWEEDYSEIKNLIEKKKPLLTDLKTYLDKNDEFVKECLSKLKILNVNNNAINILGVTTKGEFISHLSNNLNDEKLETFKETIVSIINSPKEFIKETKFLKSDGTYISVILKLVVDANLKIIVSIINISELKKIEKKLIEQNKILKIAKNKAEESDQLKTEFLNNMSHEIRTPMNGILGFSQLLSSPNLSEDKKTNFINIIKNSGNQLMRIIDNILEISRLGTKQVTAQNKEVCLNTLMFQLFSIFDIKAKENKIPLYFKKGLLDKESTIYIDEIKLNKILSNLLENAFKFTNEGHIEFGYILNNNVPPQLEICVKDTGIGINKANQQTIFDRFSQEEKDLSRKAGGLGLGLSIAKENAELLGGTITLESEKGKGATFTVVIPYTPTNPNLKQAKEIKPYKTSKAKPTILIAEDEEVNYLFLETLIHDSIKLDCNILHAKNGIETVEICKSNSTISLVLMDIKMPLMNGFEATKLIKEFNPNLSIVAQTAYSTTSDINKSIEFGCDDFISKPISKKTLTEILNKHLKIKKT